MIEYILESVEDGIRDVKMFKCWADKAEAEGHHEHADWFRKHEHERLATLKQDWADAQHEVDKAIAEL